MFCIKFKGNRRTNLKEKFCLIYRILKIIPTESRLELFFSDYTFSKTPDSKTFEFYDDTIMNNESIVSEDNSDKFITIIVKLNDGKKIRVEITPQKVRANQSYLPHIEFSFSDEDSCLFQYFKGTKKINELVRALDNYKDNIDEAYFYDPLSGLECYSDISNRLWQKRLLNKNL